MMNKNRPKHLALHKIKLPLPGMVSILHRVSGVLLFLSLPFILWIFQASLRSIETFTALAGFVHYPLVKLAILGLSWAFFHHFCAGIRYLLMDIHLGCELTQARASSRWVLAVSLVLTVLAGALLW